MYERIRNLRLEKNLTQDEVANILECKREVYRRYEKGINKVPTRVLIKLALFYNTSIDYLLEITNERNPHKRKPDKQD